MLQIVNIVGSGSLGREIDLDQLAKEIGQPQAKYEPEMHPAIYLRIDEGSPLITIYRTGKYNITGAPSRQVIYSAKENFIKKLKSIGVIDDTTEVQFSVKNIVCVGELEQGLDLNAIALQLGLDQIEYEPEQFPGLIYRPDVSGPALLVFSSGRVVITGTTDISHGEKAFKSLQEQITKG